MKKILYILSIMALVGCMNEETFVVDNPVFDSYGSFSSPLEISVGDSQTKSFDENLKWTWEESDKIYGYQVAGGKSVNTLTFVEDNRFGTPEFAYASEDAATFHFVYAGDATLDEAAEGNRGIRQDSRQSGEWRPVLVGSAVGKTISEVMNDEAEINMEHLSAALEVRLWKEGVDKNNLTDADKKNIVYAELMSDTENFLLDIVPVYNQDGTVSYTDREKGEDEEDGGYIRTEYVNSPVAVFNIAPHAENYQAGALRLAIVDENGDRYVLDVPALNFVAGQRTILNVEWKTPTSAYLPDGPTFNSTVNAFMTGKGITEIKFITNRATTSENALVDGSIYLVQNGQTLEIHTAASQYMANSSSYWMFDGYMTSFSQIQVIDFGDNFNTRNVTDMSYMFYNCSSLASLDLSNFDTQNVTDMGQMFRGCSSLTSLDVSKFDTQNVTKMGSMFSDCSNLTSLDLSNFDTQNVTNMVQMFYNCSSLTSLDVSNFTFESNPDIGDMFYSTGRNAANRPIPIYVSEEGKDYIETKGNTDINSNYAILIVNKEIAYLPDGETFNSKVDAFMTRKGITEIKFITNSATTSQNALVDGSIFLVQNGQTLEIHTAADQFVANSSCYKMFTAYRWDYSTNQYIYNSFGQIQTIDFGENFNTQNVTFMGYMFHSCPSLTSLDLSNFDTQNVTSMYMMFFECTSLTTLDVSNFDTQNVTSMGSMFQTCTSLTLLDLSSFDTQNVTDMSSMFVGCSSLTSLDLSNFDTQNVTDMGCMFEGCSSLTSLDVSNFDTQNVTDMRYMFYNCSNLTSLDLSNFDTQNVTDMHWMFLGCTSLTSLDLSNFDTQSVTVMHWMFRNCSSLTSLDVSNFKTQNVTSMSYMFYNCSKLTSLDLSNFDTQKVSNMGYMFDGCSSLTSLDVSNFNTRKVTGMNSMFSNCTSLTSLDVSNFTFEGNPNIESMFSSTGSNATNRPIPIYVSAEGKSYIATKGGSDINSNYATLTIKAPQTE